jgi:membrane-associated phospholipid phosphatase
LANGGYNFFDDQEDPPTYQQSPSILTAVFRRKIMDAIIESGLAMTQWLQESYPQLETFFYYISELGIEEFYLAVIPLIYWCIHKRLGKHLAFVFLISVMLNAIGKHAFRTPRPFWLESDLGLASEESYGVPSGHAQLATTTYLFVAGWVKKRWVWLVAIVMVILMAISRIYLGVHFWHDTLAGFLLGILVLVAYVLWQRYLARDFDKQILGYRLMFAVALPISLALVYGLIRLIIGEPDMGVAWSDFIAEAEIASIEAVATGFGALLGACVGLLLEASRVRFRVDGAVWKRALRYVIGLAITLLIWGGLRAIFPSDPLWLAIPLRVVRYVAILLWVAYYAPMVFVWLRLADAEPKPEITISLRQDDE